MDGGSDGVFISEVEPESPAERSGLLPGDRIIEVGGVTITSADLNVVAAAMRNATSPVQYVLQNLQPKKVCYGK